MTESGRPRIVGLNHIALEVGDIEEALVFYGRLFKFELRGKSDSMAIIALGDQFIALQKERNQSADAGRHLGLVVDDKEAARRALQSAGVAPIDGHFLDFRDPWHRDRRLRQYSIHQSAQRLEGNGSNPPHQERERKKGVGKKGHVA
jgi:lactoylglutathione lyase